MISKIVYKYKKLVICVLIILGVAFYFKANALFGNHIDHNVIQHTATGMRYIQSQDVIDQAAVVKALNKSHELVGLKGEMIKSYTYKDSLFKNHGWLKDWIGQRSLEITSQVHFKTGINLQEIVKSDGVKVIGNTIHIKLSDEAYRLISVDMPFNELGFQQSNGVMRGSLTMEQKQQLYGEMRRIVENNIMNDETIKANTYAGVSESLKALLGKIDNVKQVVISPRMD